MKRNEDLIREWIAALRSGEYKQGYRQLKTLASCEADKVPHFCCLGVLCEVAVKHAMIKLEGSDGYLYEYHDPYIDPDTDDNIREEGITSDLGVYFRPYVGLTNQEEMTLIRMNDGPVNSSGMVTDRTQSKSFLDIADYIEKEILPKEPEGV